MLSQNASKTTASLLVYYFLLRSYDLVHSDIPYQLCPNTTVQFHDSLFRQNLDNLLASLSSNASFSHFFATSSSSDPKIYGQYMCYGSKTRESCETCVKAASQNIKAVCPNATEAVRWEEECQLRYSKNNFLGALDVTGNKEQNNSVQQRSDRERFRFFVTRILSGVAKKAALDRSLNKYAFDAKNYKRNKTLYAVAQCTGDLSSDNCRKCLEVAIANVSSCCSYSIGARILSKSCYLRYEMYNFYGGVPEKGYKIWNNRRVIIVAVSSFVAICLLGYLLHCLKTSIRAKKGKDDQELPLHNRNDRKIDFDKLSFKSNGESKEMLYFHLATISEATRNFSESNMLGQGGFGPVYKGTLSDGSEIAVKRLSGYSKQGLEEFTNEVLLLIKLQHKNLVRLLGFSGDREEKLLIYELMPNRSLDAILFDPTKRIQLDWKSRLNIINGIARGMLYLHEDSRLKIIHRDLKASNILLDDHLNPKISDFGMARIFVGSDGEASTCRLVGTYGYMAPEYAMEGRYSVKSDVFSFGVLLLEIITGEKNTSFRKSRSAPNLIAYAWQLWNEGKELELMDPLLTEICARDAFRKCVYIGLLCVQEDANDRPTMSSVVVMLNGETEALRQPERPAFSWGTSNDYDETIVDSFSLTNVNISSASCPLGKE